MIPCECKHSIARAMSRANPTAKRMSKRFGRKFTRYLRNVPPCRSSVTITIIGSLHAPMNYLQNRFFKRYEPILGVSQMNMVGGEEKKRRNLDQILVLDFRQHCNFSRKPAIYFGDLFRWLPSFYNLDCHCLVSIPEHRKNTFINQSNTSPKLQSKCRNREPTRNILFWE